MMPFHDGTDIQDEPHLRRDPSSTARRTGRSEPYWSGCCGRLSADESTRQGLGRWVPPVSGGKGHTAEYHLAVAAALPVPSPNIALHFHVEAYTRRGQYFDMESLGYVALQSWRRDVSVFPGLRSLPNPYRPESIWLTMCLASQGCEGVEIANEQPPIPDPDSLVADVTVASPPNLSIRGTVLPELANTSELLDADWLGLELTFGNEVDIGEFGFAGPIKPLIDAMSPLLGRDRSGGPADHRLHDLRIRTDERSDQSVRIRLWYSD
jgi:hypothetical protein